MLSFVPAVELTAITKMQLSAISRWIPAIMGHFPAIKAAINHEKAAIKLPINRETSDKVAYNYRQFADE